MAAVGDGVDRFRVGDAVWCNSLGHGGRQDAFAEYALVPQGGPTGSRAFTNDAGFAGRLRQVAGFNRQHGMRVHAG